MDFASTPEQALLQRTASGYSVRYDDLIAIRRSPFSSHLGVTVPRQTSSPSAA
jgi:hypothetical protein